MKDIKKELNDYYHRTGKLPAKNDVPNLYRDILKEYGSWNNALYSTFGRINRVYRTDKERAINMLFDFYNKNKRIPKSNESSELTCCVQSAFGNWNNGLREAFGKINQERYSEDVWMSVVDFIKRNKRLPLREEFNGKEFPYWKSITRSLNVDKWSEIYTIIDISKLKYFNSSKNGTGKIYVDDFGIVYLSHQEYLIGKWLRSNNILFEKEVPYNNCDFVFDFYLNDYCCYVEYYGLTGFRDYDKRIEEKRKKYDGRKVIEIFRHENTIKKLSQEVQRL